MLRLTGELNAMKTAVAKEEGGREQLAGSAKRLEAVIKPSSAELTQVKSQLTESSAELMQLQQKLNQ
ncbi:hypothetical protein ACYZT7_16895 [Pseudomonas sp. RT4P38]